MMNVKKTYEICARPEGLVIFRGKGQRISDDRQAWDKDVNIYFQNNAWANTEFSMDWLNRTLKPVVDDLDCFVLFVAKRRKSLQVLLIVLKAKGLICDIFNTL